MFSTPRDDTPRAPTAEWSDKRFPHLDCSAHFHSKHLLRFDRVPFEPRIDGVPLHRLRQPFASMGYSGRINR